MITICLVMLVIFLIGILITVFSGILACLPIILVLAIFVLTDILVIKLIFKRRK